MCPKSPSSLRSFRSLLLLRRDLQKHVAIGCGDVTDVLVLGKSVGCSRTIVSWSARKVVNGIDIPISLLVSIFLNWTNASPALLNALDMVLAASAWPSARMTEAWRSCSAFSTTNFARSASCWAICFCSTAEVNSLPKLIKQNVNRDSHCARKGTEGRTSCESKRVKVSGERTWKKLYSR